MKDPFDTHGGTFGEPPLNGLLHFSTAVHNIIFERERKLATCMPPQTKAKRVHKRSVLFIIVENVFRRSVAPLHDLIRPSLAFVHRH